MYDLLFFIKVIYYVYIGVIFCKRNILCKVLKKYFRQLSIKKNIFDQILYIICYNVLHQSRVNM